MFQFHVKNISSFHFIERWKAPGNFTGINFTANGLKYLSIAGQEIKHTTFLTISVKGMPTEYEFDKHRENWVVILKEAPIKLSQFPGLVQISDGTQNVHLPQITPLLKIQLNSWRKRFQDMRTLQASPTPRNRMRVKIMVAEIFHYIIDQAGRHAATSPAQELKQRIDDDVGFSASIQELSDSCGYTPDHMRRLFIKSYGIAPQAYRTERRMEFATRYLTDGYRSVKEVSALVGFEFVPAFTAFYKKQTGISPRQAIQRFRSGAIEQM